MGECNCTPCDECGGFRTVWYSFGGEYLGRHRRDDMDEYEVCESCAGSGIEEICENCYFIELSDNIEEIEQNNRLMKGMLYE